MIAARALALAAALAAFAACGPRDDASAEVAGELRALRLALRGNAVVDPDRAALQAAIAAVAQTQQQFAERQAAMQAELARWTQAVAQDAGSQRSAEAAAMAKRLAELDAELQQQKARQAELESVLRQTLDRAADRIDALLQRQSGGAPPVSAPTEGGTGSGPAQGPRAAESAAGPSPVGGAGFDLRIVWAAVAAWGVVTATYLLRGRPAGGAVAVASATADDGVPVSVIAPFTSLAQGAPGGPAVVAATTTLPPWERLAVPAPRAVAALASLASDPLVLRRPAPQLVTTDAGAEIRYWLAPNCGAAAHLRLRQRALAAS